MLTVLNLSWSFDLCLAFLQDTKESKVACQHKTTHFVFGQRLTLAWSAQCLVLTNQFALISNFHYFNG